MTAFSKNDYLATLTSGDTTYSYYDITALDGVARLPYSLKVLAENILRSIDGTHITADQLAAVTGWDPQAEPSQEIQFSPSRVVMQDFTGVPCIVDLATMRDAVSDLGGDPTVINPQVPAQMVIDHSVQIDVAGVPGAIERNMDIEYKRNSERYQFLRWGQQAFSNFTVVPPGTGIIHQVNLEYLAQAVMTRTQDGGQLPLAYLDSCVGTDSHTTMVNGLGVLGWGVGGIEAEAAMLGQPISMLVPRVVGFKLSGQLREGVTATDVVLTLTDMLRQHGVVGKFVEFYGEGLAQLPLANRATIGNMSPEFGSTCAIFPVDEVSIDYLRLTGRSEEHIALVEAYAKANGLWHDTSAPDYIEPAYSEYMNLDLSTVEPSIAGPKRPQDRIPLRDSKQMFEGVLPDYLGQQAARDAVPVTTDKGSFALGNGHVAIASITSCTNTSNPSVMIAAGLLARNAHRLGLSPKPWVKTSLAPGSQVVTDYLDAAGLTPDLDALGYQLVGYGCATCIGNSGPLDPAISQAVNDNDLTVTAVLSGNRNFEGRISPDVKMNYLASPPLVIAYALAGTMDFDFEAQPLGTSAAGKPVFLRDIWPTNQEIQGVVDETVSRDMFVHDYQSVFEGDARWKGLDVPQGESFAWNEASTYVRRQTFFDGMSSQPEPIAPVTGARVLALLGDSVTTDHISPAGSIKSTSPAGLYLTEHGIERRDFNSYGSRRGNHEVMVRGTFGNIRLRNLLLPAMGQEQLSGGYTYDFLAGQTTSIFEAAENYRAHNVPLVILAGSEYGTGSSRDWAAKGTAMLGVRAVIARSFERIHRSNLVGMGVLPLQFPDGESTESLGLTGQEAFTISGMEGLSAGSIPQTLPVTAVRQDGTSQTFDATVRIDTPGEADYFRNGGILQYVLRNLMA